MSDSRLHKKLVFLIESPLNIKKTLYVTSKALRQRSQKFWPKILTLNFFYSDLYLHFLDHAVEIFSKLYV